MKYRSVLFDLDGTLTDSGPGIVNCTIFTLKAFGLPIPTGEQLRTVVGPPLKDSFRRFGVPEDRLDQAVQVYRSRYVPIGKFENEPYPGIRQMLEALLERGYRLYVATSKPEEISEEILSHFDLSRYFTVIRGATDDSTRSTKSEVIAALLDEGLNPRECVMVGDTAFDVLGAASFGIPAIGVAWGYGKVEDMEKAGAAAFAQTPASIPELLRWMENN